MGLSRNGCPSGINIQKCLHFSCSESGNRQKMIHAMTPVSKKKTGIEHPFPGMVVRKANQGQIMDGKDGL